MWLSKKRLSNDIDRWQASGWLTPEGERRIRGELTGGREIGLSQALGILASVLFGFAVMSFVAAHWEEIPRLGRVSMLLVLLWCGYAAAGFFAKREQTYFADAAVLFAVAIFGASIMLISQIYHIDGNAADGVLLWWIGALFSGVVLRSNPALALAMVLVCTWGGIHSSDSFDVYWPFLIGWAAVSAAFVWQRWWPGLHLSAIALSTFVVSLGFLLETGHEHAIVIIIGLFALAGLLAAERVRPDWEGPVAALVPYAGIVTFAGLFSLQFFENPDLGTLIVYAAVTLVFMLAAIAYGRIQNNGRALWAGYAGFSLEILALYAKTVGSILGTSLFFLIAGLIVAALAYVAFRLMDREEKASIA